MKTDYDIFLEETANSICTQAHDFNNRANARAALGRHDEALRDYDKACSLEPEDPSFLLNQAGLFLELGMKKRALENVRRAWQLGGQGDVADPHGLFRIAQMFLICDNPDSAEKTLLAFLRFLQLIIPCAVKEDGGGYIIKKDGHTIHTSDIVDFDEVDRFVRAIRGGKDCKGIAQPESLLKQVKRDFVYHLFRLTLRDG